MIKNLLKTILPDSARTLVRSNAALRNLAGDAPVIQEGLAKGLRFDPGPSNFRYAVGDIELPVQEALARSVAPGSVFFDIGANVGYLTVMAAKLVGPQGRVEAFEPVPENAAYVRLNVGLNDFKNVTVHECAVSASAGECEFWVADNSGGGALAGGVKPPDVQGSIRVPVVTIDSEVFSGKLPPPAYVKIDVEGFELEVLSGMDRTLREHKPVVLLEVDDAELGPLEAKQAACETFLRERHYEIEVLPHSYTDTSWLVRHCLASVKGSAA